MGISSLYKERKPHQWSMSNIQKDNKLRRDTKFLRGVEPLQPRVLESIWQRSDEASLEDVRLWRKNGVYQRYEGYQIDKL